MIFDGLHLYKIETTPEEIFWRCFVLRVVKVGDYRFSGWRSAYSVLAVNPGQDLAT